MKMLCSLVRDGVTSTSVMVDTIEMNDVRRWVISSMRRSGCDAHKYHFIAWADCIDISNSDVLEDMTGGITGVTFNIINKRTFVGNHTELDLERRYEFTGF